LPVATYEPDNNLLYKYDVRVTPFMFMVDEKSIIRTNQEPGQQQGRPRHVLPRYRELKPVKFEPPAEGEEAADFVP